LAVCGPKRAWDVRIGEQAANGAHIGPQPHGGPSGGVRPGLTVAETADNGRACTQAFVPVAEANCEQPLDIEKVKTMARSILNFPPGTPAVEIPMGQQVESQVYEPVEQAERYAMTPEEIEVEMGKEFPIIPLVPQVGPEWDDSMMYGICGDIVRKAAQYCEAHSAGMYLDLLVSVGSIIGRGPYFNINKTRHYTNEFMARAGDTSDSRKGTGRDVIDAALRLAAADWYSDRVLSGFGSGEAIVGEIRDPMQQSVRDKKGPSGFSLILVPGVNDKRLCIREGELASVFLLAGKKESRADIIIRDGWDGKTLRNVVKGKSRDGISNSASCKEPHLSISVDSTRSKLHAKMPKGAGENGFGNRFLYCYVYRTKLCPNGGPELDWMPEITRLHKAIQWAKDLQYVPLTGAAKQVWNRMYLELDSPSYKLNGLAGLMTARAAAHILRLALIFALLDEMDVVDSRHLQAARKLWDYCQDSAQYIFSGTTHNQNLICQFIERNGPATVSQITQKLFHKNKTVGWVKAEVDALVTNTSHGVIWVGDTIALKR